ncbi:hypothetical protein ACW0US_17845 [Xanthomonas euvesicatoria]
MSNQRPLKANEIVGLFAQLMGVDVTAMANIVGNIPRSNVLAWLSGKKENLRHESVLRLMDLVGLKVEHGVQLDPGRVHIWQVRDGVFSSGKKCYASLRLISRLLEHCAITRVEPPTRGFFAKRTRQLYLISGDGVRVVIDLHKSIFKRARVSPEMLVGTLWRDESDPDEKMPHTISATREKWQLLLSRDLAPYEFDQIFDENEPNMQWLDVAMLAREYAVTPDTIHAYIKSEFGRGGTSGASSRPRNGLVVDSSVILLSDHAQRAA